MHEPPMVAARRLAREQKLRGMSFFDAAGNKGARGKNAVRVELEFANGEKVSLTQRELAMLKDVQFKLEAVP